MLKNIFKITPTHPYNKGFTRLVNPSRSSSRSIVSATQPNFCSRSPELRPSGFTLAEVLITLVIIGVIAAITVPNMIVNYQKKMFLDKLKQMYSILQNAKNKAEADYGPMKYWSEDTVFFDTYIKPYLYLTRYSKTHTTHFVNGSEHPLYNDPFRHSYFTRYMLANGVELSVQSCSIGGIYSNCSFFVDLNGPKGPNTYGKDIHSFVYYFNPTYVNFVQHAGKFYPGTFWNATKDNCLITNENYTNGIMACTFLIYKNNWQYPDWYPW